ncbi:hypothetical protein HSX37_08320|uniref:DUF5683 domain-containing protein n=1 Tax=Dendrosporobacter quercicolus TaxID=146817 RepID=A0A1G9US69_9FIRM|nr:hypothetical protein [Dendrosporobacter quercicolus]NSL48047.1 hypothetical protein [Dendrosporobacter quercicolus DSM 1736]SDM62761.1 hypothetical protein SAMN04488502_10644 [Dendrosporobacter quercicolus]
MKLNELQDLTYRSPWVALGWSAMIPGLGQVYNQEYLLGIAMILFEFFINNHAQLNLAIHHSFNFNFAESRQVIDYHWLQFYPALWTYGMWQAYNKALEINKRLRDQGVTATGKPAHFSGFFIGLTVGMHLGSFWGFGGSPVWSGLAIGFISAIIGGKLEKRFSRQTLPDKS